MLAGAYGAYVDSFRGADGELPPMMRLKRIHTEHVVENARAIAAGEGFDSLTARACEAAALLHDTGRYEQLRRYNTFRDSDSVDHAVFSHDIVVEKGWLAADFFRSRLLGSAKATACLKLVSAILLAAVVAILAKPIVSQACA